MSLWRWYCDRAERKGVYPRTAVQNHIITLLTILLLIVAILAMIAGPIERTPIFENHP